MTKFQIVKEHLKKDGIDTNDEPIAFYGGQALALAKYPNILADENLMAVFDDPDKAKFEDSVIDHTSKGRTESMSRIQKHIDMFQSLLKTQASLASLYAKHPHLASLLYQDNA